MASKYMLNPSPRLALACLAVALAACFPPASYAKNSALTPAKVKQIKKNRKSYDDCRKDALAQLKLGATSKTRFQASLTACKENFPGADLYVHCKQEALKAARAQNVVGDQPVSQCKRYLLATQFDPTEPVPFFIENGQEFFAGIGLNLMQPANAVNPPNFRCDKLRSLVHGPEKAEYILFGNHPRSFAPLASLNDAALHTALKVKTPKRDGVDVPGFGRLFGDPRKANALVFFPVASCDFDADPGKMLSGLSAFYLLDSQRGSVTPYFGIAYFRAEQNLVTTKKLVQQTLIALGSSFKATPKNDHVSFLTAAKIKETDEEKDPRNLCRQPREHRFVGIVQSYADRPQHPEYLIIANVANLCDFGDHLANSLGG